MIDKIDIALGFLQDNIGFTINYLRLSIVNGSTLSVDIWSDETNFSRLTQGEVIMKMSKAENMFEQMISISEGLKEFIKDKKVQFNVNFDSYGKGSILICSKKNKIIEWLIEI